MLVADTNRPNLKDHVRFENVQLGLNFADMTKFTLLKPQEHHDNLTKIFFSLTSILKLAEY